MSMNDKWIKQLKELTSDQIDEMAELIFKDLEEIKQNGRLYYTSPTYARHYSLIKEFVDEHGSLGDNPYSFPLDPILSNEEFCQFVSVTMDIHSKDVNTSYPEDAFETETLHLNEDLELLAIHGQGTAYIVRKFSASQK